MQWHVYIYREREGERERDRDRERESTEQSDDPTTTITLKQKLEMVYSFTFYVALYIYIYILSLYLLSHLQLSKWTGQSCISFYSKFLSISLLLVAPLLPQGATYQITSCHVLVSVCVCGGPSPPFETARDQSELFAF